jgi:hypothetical protein
MASKFDSRDWMSALGQPDAAGSRTRGDAVPVPSPADAERQKREKLQIKAIEARVKLKLMRDRTEALKQALARFRAVEEARRA